MRVGKVYPNIENTARSNKKQKNDVLNQALLELKKIKFEVNDSLYMGAIGANLPFKSGEEAYNYILENNIKVEYGKMPFSDVHAIYVNENRTIKISEKYKNAKSFPEILALSEAILHEVGHAKDLDNNNSVQEELDCLALNALAHRYHKKTYPNIFVGQNSLLFKEGVSLYENLFYEFDPKKTNLGKRILDKYGFLPRSSKGHSEGKFVKNI